MEITFSWCEVEDAVACDRCGSIVAREWQPEHRRFHEEFSALVTASNLAEPAFAPVVVERLGDEGQG
jgi:hypothetical protein